MLGGKRLPTGSAQGTTAELTHQAPNDSLLATSTTRRAVDPSDGAAVGLNALLSIHRLYALPVVAGRTPWRRFDRSTGLPAEIGSDLLFANRETLRVAGGPAAIADRVGVPLWQELGYDPGPDHAVRAGACRSPDPRRSASTPALSFSLTEQAPARAPGSLAERTSCERPPATSADCSIPDGPVTSGAGARLLLADNLGSAAASRSTAPLV